MSSWKVYGQPISRVIVGSAIAGSLAFLYYLMRKTRSEDLHDATQLEVEGETPAAKANRLKQLGNQHFGSQHYDKAAELFLQAIEVLKELDDGETKSKALAVLYNNYSACMEFRKRLDEAMEYATMAVELNPTYLKPYIRRSRVYKQKMQLKNCLWDCGKIVRLLNKDPTSFKFEGEGEKYLTEIILIAKDIVNQNALKLLERRTEREIFLPISQTNVVEWMKLSCIHDPLLNRMKELGKTEPTEPLNLALFHLKNFEYLKALPIALEVAVDSSADLRKRFLGRLLAARIYFFAGLRQQFDFVYQMLNDLWSNSSEDFKKDNVDLLVTIMILKMYVEAPMVVESELLQNMELWTGNADAFIVLSIIYHRLLQFEFSLKALEYAKQVEPDRSHLIYHEFATKFAAVTQTQDIGLVPQITAAIDQHIRNDTNPPEHAVILAARVFTVSQNSAYALELLDKHKDKGDGNIGMQLLYTVVKHDQEGGNTRTADFQRDLESLLERDPHNFETLRMLFRCAIENGEFEKAAELAKKAWLNTRTIEEFSSAYHDFVLAASLAGIDIPMNEYPPFDGPDYPRANSEEYVLRFSDSTA